MLEDRHLLYRGDVKILQCAECYLATFPPVGCTVAVVGGGECNHIIECMTSWHRINYFPWIVTCDDKCLSSNLVLALLTCTCVAGMKMQYLNYKSPLIATNALPHQLSKRSYSHHLQVLDAFSRQYQHGFLVKVCRDCTLIFSIWIAIRIAMLASIWLMPVSSYTSVYVLMSPWRVLPYGVLTVFRVDYAIHSLGDPESWRAPRSSIDCRILLLEGNEYAWVILTHTMIDIDLGQKFWFLLTRCVANDAIANVMHTKHHLLIECRSAWSRR